MANYTFLNLSPAEFEELTRDLLQKQLNLTLESFTNGKDGGIDFRHSYFPKSELIIQCKRYKDFGALLSNLKTELIKIRTLLPTRYILTTSVGLTPNQKTQIYDLLSPYITSPADIYGCDDINNLLNIFPEVEKAHFKLWMSSVNILQQIIHSRIYNQTHFEEQEIQQSIKLYVNNNSYYNAQVLLEKFRYVIISGSPGIGKTTLARILSYYYLANGYEEFIFLSESIDEGFSIYKEHTSQVFFFDDFLGTNFLNKNLKNNEEQRIIKFIEQIGRSANKLLIMTTREYILAQARNRYEVLDDSGFNISRCVIDLQQYTKVVRAKILYNHIYFSQVGQAYITELLTNKNYDKIISHSNYSPRIIETITRPSLLKGIVPEKFIEKFLEFLDYPESIWKHVYENQISRFSQIILGNLMTAGTPMGLDRLKEVSREFSIKHANSYGYNYSEIDFRKSVKELENTFIKISRDTYNYLVVEYMNPSVQDFLVGYFDNSTHLVKDIIETSIYFNQLFTLFTFSASPKSLKKSKATKSEINVGNELAVTFKNKIVSDFESLGSSLLVKRVYSKLSDFYWHTRELSILKKLDMLNSSELMEIFPELKDFVITRFQEQISLKELTEDDQRAFINLLINYHTQVSFDKDQVFYLYTLSMDNLDHFDEFKRLETIFGSALSDYIWTDDNFHEKIKEMLSFEIDYVANEDIEDLIETIKILAGDTGIDFEVEIRTLEERYSEYKEGITPSAEYDSEKFRRIIDMADGTTDIKNMFDSLRIPPTSR